MINKMKEEFCKVCRLWFIILLSTETCKGQSKMANQGSTYKEDIRVTVLNPKSFQHTVNNAYWGERILLATSKDSTRRINICNLNSSLIIEKSLTFVGLYGQAKVWCLWNKTAIIIRQPDTDRRVRVKFINIQFVSYYNKDTDNASAKCKPSQSGFIRVDKASLELENCIFTEFCTAVRLLKSEGRNVELLVRKTTFTSVQNAVYGTDLSNLNFSLLSTTISGPTFKRGFLFQAVTLITTGPANIEMRDSKFEQLNEALSVSFLNQNVNVTVTNCVFESNSGQSVILNFARPLSVFTSRVLFVNNIFQNNNGDYASTIHFIYSPSTEFKAVKFNFDIYLQHTKFYNNCAQAFFGSIYADAVNLVIQNCEFEHNIAGHQEGSIQGFGGALYVEEKARVTVVDTYFNNNTCSGFGGTIFSRGTLILTRCYFHGPSSKFVRALLGDVLYATAGLSMENTTWVLRRTAGSKSIIWHPGSPTLEMWGIKIRGYFYAVCPSGHNITHYGVVREVGSLTDRLSLSCRACSRNEYSLQAGSLYVIQRKGEIKYFQQINATCFRCKYGGICERGYIRSKSNYYGYKMEYRIENITKINFISCPNDYCCREDECTKYNSCQKTRKGVLCGSCNNELQLTENIINSKCVEEKRCKDKWFWLIYFPLGLIYVMFFIYLDKISGFVKGQLLWWERAMTEIKEGDFSSDWLDVHDLLDDETSMNQRIIESQRKQNTTKEKEETSAERQLSISLLDKEQEEKTETQIEDDFTERKESIESTEGGRERKVSRKTSFFSRRTSIFSRRKSVVKKERKKSRKEEKQEKEKTTVTKTEYTHETKERIDSFSDIINITFYFYQMVLLIKTHDNVVLRSILNTLRTIYSSIFTFSIESNNEFTVCPIKDLTPVTKTLLIKSFAAYVIAILLLLHLGTELYRLARKEEYLRRESTFITSLSFSVRLRVATIQVLFLTYAAFTNMSFNLVNCVPLDQKYVLYIDGNVECFRWWQILDFGFMIGWIIPFPFALVLSTVDLREKRITYHQFAAAWVFPLVYLLVVSTLRVKFYIKRTGEPDEAPSTEVVPSKDHKRSKSVISIEDDVTIMEILNRIEGSYKGRKKDKDSDRMNDDPKEGPSTETKVEFHVEITDSKTEIHMPQPAFWQGVLIGRRLILITCFTFINSPVTRLYVALLACVVFLIHHLLYQPYIKKSSNYVELASSTGLVVFCSMNLFFAYSYVSDVPPEGADETISLVFDWVEVSVLVILPSLVILGIFTLFTLRLCILLIYSGVRLVRK